MQCGRLAGFDVGISVLIDTLGWLRYRETSRFG